jgi:hypothetical protein
MLSAGVKLSLCDQPFGPSQEQPMSTPHAQPGFWRSLRNIAWLLVLIRVPLLMVIIGALLVWHVPQIADLFAISRGNSNMWCTLAAATILGVMVWASARTLYSFDWNREGHSVGARAGEWLPRVLGALVPLTMAFGYLRVPSASDSRDALWFFLAAALVFFGTWKRRDLGKLMRERTGLRGSLSNLIFGEQQAPAVGSLRHWSRAHGEPALGTGVGNLHLFGIAVPLLATVVGSLMPDLLTMFGPLALILGAATFLTWASTAPVYWATRRKIPLLTVLLLWATAISFLIDNHAVRLAPGMRSTEHAVQGLNYESGARQTLEQYAQQFVDQRRECERIYLIASEGGGIRAAMWTALVLGELESQSQGKFWRCTLAASGVSGGSLGLAVFAATMRDFHDHTLAPEQLLAERVKRARLVLEVDFLSPVLASMFGADQLQRFLPLTIFSDRGQALEDAWIRSYRKHIKAEAESFSAPLVELLRGPSPTPLLLLNTTVVASGERLIQHPLQRLTCSKSFEQGCIRAVQDSVDWLPAELPLSSAVLNSARFTFVSPAGTVYQPKQGQTEASGQLVDGGYFENSGLETLRSLQLALADIHPNQFPPTQIIHISNDVGLNGVMRHNEDDCAKPEPPEFSLWGELLSPMMALYQSRSARGERARVTTYWFNENRFWHFRLCASDHPIPLGWTVSEDTVAEMLLQLSGNHADVVARLNRKSSNFAAGFTDGALIKQALGIGATAHTPAAAQLPAEVSAQE